MSDIKVFIKRGSNMIKIDVDGEFLIDKDTHNWILKHKVKELKEPNKDKLVTIGYYGSLKQLAKGIVERIDIADSESIEDLTDAYDDLIDVIEKKLETETKG
jgi:hypothetical protein